MKLLKILCLPVLTAAFALALAGCMSGGNVGVQPEPTADFMPQATNSGANRPAAGNAAAENKSAFDWKQQVSRIEGQISRISEISECRVVVADDVALVGVKFDPAYKGEMTERIREMVAAEVMAADPGITTVAVTAYEDDVDEVYELADKMALGRDVSELKEEVSEIVRNATTLR